MDARLEGLLRRLEGEGAAYDAAEAAHARRRLNLERPTAELVALLLRMHGARRVLEIGTSNGISALWIADALRDADGRLVTVERDADKSTQAAANLREAGLDDRVELRVGDATAVVRELDGPFDAVLFDADRLSAPEQLDLLAPKLAPRPLLMADNALSHPDEIAGYLEAVGRLDGFHHAVVPVGKGLSVAFRVDGRAGIPWRACPAMTNRTPPRLAEPLALGRSLLKWIALASWVGLLSGLASAGFLWALDRALAARDAHPALLFGLPLAGAAIGLTYHHLAGRAAGGNNLLLEEIHDPQGPVPFRMAPLILVTTVVTHLFGGSAGREGSAVQMGGTLAEVATLPLRLSASDRRALLMAGIAAGFGSVFGTPLAGAIFGLEVLALGRLEHEALVPCLVASVVGDLVCRGVGIRHHAYGAPVDLVVTPMVLGWTLLASVLFAAASVGFVELAHLIGRVGKDVRGAPWVRPLVGGLLIVAMTLAVGSQTYNGLGLPLIEASFHGGGVPPYAFALKLVFTAVTLGAGFKGGEVTPLFCIGATLGSTFAGVTGQDPALFAALGFVAVFAGAANTPLACAVMGVELFGSALAVPLAIACVVAYVLSGHRGIYPSQRVHRGKGGTAFEEGATLRSYRP